MSAHLPTVLAAAAAATESWSGRTGGGTAARAALICSDVRVSFLYQLLRVADVPATSCAALEVTGLLPMKPVGLLP